MFQKPQSDRSWSLVVARSFYTKGMHFSRARLRGHRDGQGLTIGVVAERAHLSPIDYARMEAGELVPTDVQLVLLAAAMNVLPQQLLREGPESTWADEYADAAISHLDPMSSEEVARVAKVLGGTR